MATIVFGAVAGNWSDGTKWVGGVAPTAADDAQLTVTSANCTIDGTSGSPNLCRSLNCTGYTNTLTHASAKQLNIGDASGGALTIVAGMTYAPSGTAVINFASTTTGNHIKWGGKDIPSLTFDGVGGGWVFDDAPAGVSVAPVVTITNGAVDFNGKNITGGLSSSNSNTRSITFGTMTWTLGGAGTSQNFDIGTTTGLTISSANLTIANTSTTASASTITTGGTYLALTSTALTTGRLTITGSPTFGTVTLSMGATTKTTTSGYILGGNLTVTGTFTANGNTTLLRNFIYSDTLGTPRTITAATVSVTHTDLRDIVGAGAGSWNFSGLTTTANGDAGGNSGITFTTAKDCYLKVNANANWSASNWFTASGGSSAIVPAMPLIHDRTHIDSGTGFTVSRTITLDEPRLPSVDWTGAANTPAFATSTAYEAYGSIILISGMTHTGGYSLDGGALTWPASSTITLNAPGGTYSLASNFTSSAGITTTAGTLAEAGFTANVTAINVNGGTWSGSGAITGTTCTVAGGTFTPGATLTLTGALAVSSGILNMNGNQITGHTTATISGTGTLNLSGQLNGSGAISVTGGTITDSGASGELKGTTASFSGGTSAIRKMTLSSTFAMSATANLTLNPGTYVYVTSWTQTGTTHTLTYNGTAQHLNGTLTVTAAAAAGLAAARVFTGF